jgi:hypothetical protein
LLGWLNATIEVRHQSDSDGNELVREIANRLQDRLSQAGAEIAHLKMTLTPEGGLGDLAVVNVVRNDFVAELGQRLDDSMQNGQLILNLRAESDPEVLESLVRETFDAVALANQNGLVLKIDDLERFRPGRPEPTHRDLVEITP